MNWHLQRVLGRLAAGGLQETDATRADGMPPRPSEPAAVQTPGSDLDTTQADVEMTQGHEQLRELGPIGHAMALWQAGEKYELAEYLLHSDFHYVDFVRMLFMMPANDALELASILDELGTAKENPPPPPAVPGRLAARVSGSLPDKNKTA